MKERYSIAANETNTKQLPKKGMINSGANTISAKVFRQELYTEKGKSNSISFEKIIITPPSPKDDTSEIRKMERLCLRTNRVIELFS